MTRSDWIALIAALAAVIGLVPAFGQYLRVAGRKTKRKPGVAPASQIPGNNSPDKPMPPYIKALACTSMALVILVVELVLYSWIAHYFSIPSDFHAMPVAWEFGFVAIFLVPGLLLFLAFVHIVSTFED